MKTGLFINTDEAKCSIHSSGKMFYNSLTSDEWKLDYVEIGQLNRQSLLEFGKIVSHNPSYMNLLMEYDFYILNYHPLTMREIHGINASVLKNKLKGKKFSFILEMLEDEILPSWFNLNKDDFDGYLVVDPTFKTSDPTIHVFPRPLFECKPINKLTNIPEVPVIGSYGFQNEDKNFHLVIEQASKEFERSIVRINIPYATYMGIDIMNKILSQCLSNQPSNVDVRITHEFFSDEDLVDWCMQNDLNVFMYSRNMAGLAACPDQVLMSGAPLLVSDNNAFRHIHPYIRPFPEWSFRDAMLKSQDQIEIIRQDWSKQKFIEKFRQVLQD